MWGVIPTLASRGIGYCRTRTGSAPGFVSMYMAGRWRLVPFPQSLPMPLGSAGPTSQFLVQALQVVGEYGIHLPGTELILKPVHLVNPSPLVHQVGSKFGLLF